MRSRNLGALVILATVSCTMLGCESKQSLEAKDLSGLRLPIINGTRVTGDSRLNTVMLGIKSSNYSDRLQAFCTGTLISPNYVLTAGHCVANCNDGSDSDIVSLRPYMRVGIAQSESDIRKVYGIKRIIIHGGFVCERNDIRNDIALLELTEPVSSSVAVPSPVMTPALDMKANEVNPGPARVTAVGFGRTNSAINGSGGTKYQTSFDVYGACSHTGTWSSKCDTLYRSGYNTNGIIYSYENRTGTCQGDSGGPIFWNRDGVEYVVGVTSWGAVGCAGISAYTMVSDYYTNFIARYVTDLPSNTAAVPTEPTNPSPAEPEQPMPAPGYPDNPSKTEICDNFMDDNGNGLVDCDDPQCFGNPVCTREDCFNGKDDNGDGLIDCKDPQCKALSICDIENCTNGIDDNDNGLIDCKDPQCTDSPSCKPEDCTNGIDDNGDWRTDCYDPQCYDEPICRPEFCSNGKDDNGDGLTDCDDPQCADSLFCWFNAEFPEFTSPGSTVPGADSNDGTAAAGTKPVDSSAGTKPVDSSAGTKPVDSSAGTKPGDASGSTGSASESELPPANADDGAGSVQESEANAADDDACSANNIRHGRSELPLAVFSLIAASGLILRRRRILD